MAEIFYYIPDDGYHKTAADKVFSNAMRDELSLGSAYDDLCENVSSIFAESNFYIDHEDASCIKVDYEVVRDDDKNPENTHRKITGYTIGYKPAPKKEEKETTLTDVLVLAGIFFVGALVGRKSVPYRPLNIKKDKIKYPDLRYNRPHDVSSESFHNITDWYSDKMIETFLDNDLYICKGKKRRK